VLLLSYDTALHTDRWASQRELLTGLLPTWASCRVALMKWQ
jgi:hypothetical protein